MIVVTSSSSICVIDVNMNKRLHMATEVGMEEPVIARRVNNTSTVQFHDFRLAQWFLSYHQRLIV